jgi:hypothetical protein
MTPAEQRRELARLKLLTGYAVKFTIDTPTLDPTDANLAKTLAGCARPPHPEDYPQIRLLVDFWRDTRASAAAAVVETLLTRAQSYTEDSLKFSGMLRPGTQLDPLTENDARRYADIDRILADELRKTAAALWPGTSHRHGSTG